MKLTVAVLVLASTLLPTAWATEDHPALGDRRSALIGLSLVGAAATTEWDDAAQFALAVGILAGVRSGLGTLIGTALPTTHWHTIDTKGLRVSVAPVPRGAALHVSVTF